MRHLFAEESLACLDALPFTTPLACSTVNGWRSLLVRHSRSMGSDDPYDTLTTPDHKLVVVTRGEVDVELHKGGNWRRMIYRPGLAGLSLPGEIDRLRLRVRNSDDHFEKIHVFLPRQLIEEAADHLRPRGRSRPDEALASMTWSDGALGQIASTLLVGLRRGLPEFFAESAASWLALQLLTHQDGMWLEDRARDPGAMPDARLRRAIEYMACSFGEPLTLGQVAAEAGVSKFHFTRLFRLRTGRTPMQHLLEIRLATAARLLKTTDLPISQIALECGMPGPAHFSGAFRRRFGMSPKRHRTISSHSGEGFGGT